MPVGDIRITAAGDHYVLCPAQDGKLRWVRTLTTPETRKVTPVVIEEASGAGDR